MFRELKAHEVEARVATCSEKGASLLLYKTARTDYAVLDETVGADHWQCEYREVKGNLYCRIGIYSDALQQWVYKENCGTESNQEAQKGEASDAFKRAGFAWGIGRELYTAPFIWISADKLQRLQKGSNGRWQCYDKFEVKTLDIVDGQIVGLSISHEGRADIVYRLHGSKPSQAKKAAKSNTTTKKAETPPQNSPQQATDGNTEPTPEQVNEMIEKVLEFAALRGRPAEDVLKALNSTKAMKAAGATEEQQSYTAEQTVIAIGQLNSWIMTSKKGE